MLNLLQDRDRARRRNREALRIRTLKRLRSALDELLPAAAVWVYGSILEPGKFSAHSDVDVALENEPATVSIYVLQSLLSARVGCEVDLCVLDESRLKNKIQRTGQRWIG